MPKDSKDTSATTKHKFRAEIWNKDKKVADIKDKFDAIIIYDEADHAAGKLYILEDGRVVKA